MRLDSEAGLRPLGRRRPRSLDDALLPLINIVFLLMVFFLFVGRLDGRRGDERAPVSQHPVSQPAAASPRQLELRPDGLLQIGATRFAEAELADRVSGWRGGAVDLRSDADVPAERALRVMGVLRAAGINEVRLLTVRPRTGN